MISTSECYLYRLAPGLWMAMEVTKAPNMSPTQQRYSPVLWDNWSVPELDGMTHSPHFTL